jgi:protocatechuate 3,4-dioxygenase beta subunit
MFFAATTMRMAMRLPITSLCAAVIFAACHSAAPPVAAGSQPPSGPPVVVRGVVMDMKSNSPLSDAGIELQVPGRRAVTAAVTATDGRGEFVLDAVPPGTYRLRVTRVGFNELQMRVDVIRPDQGPLTIHLRALDIKCPASRYHTPECP